MRELELTSLRINFQELHLNLVTLLDTCFLDSLQTLPVNLRDVEQTVLARHELYEAAVRHDAANSTLVNLTNLGDGNDSLDLSQCGIDALLVRSANLYLTNAINLVDSDSSTGILLHLLDNLTTRANDSTNELLRNLNLNDARNLRLQLSAWLSDSISNALQDVLTTSLSLHQRLLQNIE